MSKPVGGPSIGVFDSGIGGLTVVKALLAEAPDVRLVYFGDTARLPYGTKSDATVIRQSLECIRFLMGFDVGLLVVACNTASSIALPALTRAVDIPVIGVVESGVQAALEATRSGVIGVIGTAATIRSGGYERRLREIRPDVEVISAACPLFVPLVEEGWIDHAVTRAVAEEYLAPLLARKIDTLILGCTHYPLLRETLQAVVGEGVKLIDTGAETAREVAKYLREIDKREGGVGAPGARGTASGIGTPSRAPAEFFVSDVPSRFEANGARFLGRPLGSVTLVEQSDIPWYERPSSRSGGPS
jgi:glutamate racemase